MIYLQTALKLLSESANELEIAPWQNTHIIRLLLNQGKNIGYLFKLIAN